MSQQDPPDLAAQRREIVIATLAAAVHRWHREQIRVGVRAKRAASIAPSELPSDPAPRRGRLVYRRPVSPLAVGWPETPQNPSGLAIRALCPPRSRFESISGDRSTNHIFSPHPPSVILAA